MLYMLILTKLGFEWFQVKPKAVGAWRKANTSVTKMSYKDYFGFFVLGEKITLNFVRLIDGTVCDADQLCHNSRRIR